VISFITGKPGDGKSLFAARQIIEDLVKTDVFVVTNVPLNVATLSAYVSARRDGFVLDERVKCVPDAEVYEFHRHRSGGLVLPWSPDKDAGEDGTKRLSRPDLVAKLKADFELIRGSKDYQRPVHYYIDEAHNFFSAREWATNGRALLYYASQHRHLHDNVYLITQVMENVEKQLRGLVSETHMVRNQLRRRIGPVKMRPIFRVKSFYGVPQHNVRPFAETTFDLDLTGVASCYRTVGALGVHSTPEKQNNSAPLPWWTLPLGGVALVATVVAAFLALPYVGARIGRATVGSLQGANPLVLTGGAQRADGGPKPAAVEQAGGSPLPLGEGEGARGRSVETRASVTVHGYVVRGSRVNVLLSDGRTLIEGDPTLDRIERNRVVFRDGSVAYFHRATSHERIRHEKKEPPPASTPTS